VRHIILKKEILKKQCRNIERLQGREEMPGAVLKNIVFWGNQLVCRENGGIQKEDS